MAEGMTERGRIGEIIRKHLAYTNGWRVSDDVYQRDLDGAADDILRYLKRRDAQVNKKSGKVEGLRRAEEIVNKTGGCCLLCSATENHIEAIRAEREKLEGEQ